MVIGPEHGSCHLAGLSDNFHFVLNEEAIIEVRDVTNNEGLADQKKCVVTCKIKY